MDRTSQLEALKRELEKLLSVLREDEGCNWLNHFERSLEKTCWFLENGYEQSQLNDLSSSIRSVYGGMGSFNDYVPPQSTWGTNRFSNRVWETALDLQVTGKR
ncbi:hypothetical protein [Aliikangiella sp. G2MR2-5]|uniref:DUF6966 domain-containing protein n=1 Tax=Aliikangiella sp. G2MR2-5 TaxID=2788943 RepID=UPI0018A95951|nr:hypothetical protein [Aliikangiella sp. G2MR2-5]